MINPRFGGRRSGITYSDDNCSECSECSDSDPLSDSGVIRYVIRTGNT